MLKKGDRVAEMGYEPTVIDSLAISLLPTTHLPAPTNVCKHNALGSQATAAGPEEDIRRL